MTSHRLPLEIFTVTAVTVVTISMHALLVKGFTVTSVTAAMSVTTVTSVTTVIAVMIAMVTLLFSKILNFFPQNDLEKCVIPTEFFWKYSP